MHEKKQTEDPFFSALFPPKTFKGNIENFMGLCAIPMGKAGPLLMHGEHAVGAFDIPLATTEGALVASYNRGLKAAFTAGGFKTYVLAASVQRAPLIKCENAAQAIELMHWILQNEAALCSVVQSTGRFVKLQSIEPNVEGNELILLLHYEVGDASGQNMVTIASQTVCNFIAAKAPITPQKIFIESNASGDKKIRSQTLSRVRGKRVLAEVIIPEKEVKAVLKSTPKSMVEYWTSSTLAQIKSGALGNQGHIANGLTAMFLATGQDVACITEAAQGVTRLELTPDGGLYASLTLSNLIVGSVGGGTSLPTQKACLEMMDCYGTGKANKLAEIMCAVALAGELSIAAAIVEGHFTNAHKTLGRK